MSPSTKVPDPHSEYERRLAERTAAREALESRFARISHLRVAAFALFVFVLWWVWGPRDGSAHWIWVPVGLFATLVWLHGYTTLLLRRAQRAVEYYERGLARLRDEWVGLGPTGLGFLDAEHPYAVDLDLFGDGSLFQRVCLARTGFGQRQLAEWLLTAASPTEIALRQAAVSELQDQVDLRETLALEGSDLEEGGDPWRIVRWADPSQEGLGSSRLWLFVGAATLMSLCGLLAWFWWGWGVSLLVLAAIVQILLRMRLQKRLDGVTNGLDDARDELRLLARVLALFETAPVQSEWLRNVQSSLQAEARPPSVWIARLDRLFDVFESRRNSLFSVFVFLFALDFHVAFFIQRWRQQAGSHVEAWVRAVAQLEAVASLAGYAYERPDDIVPTPVKEKLASVVEAKEIGHPLLPLSSCMRNDFRLGGDGPRLVVVSGSNMSGKSTFLRAVGTNLVLASAGGTVRARRFDFRPIRVGASIRIQDSIQAGISHFYAEIRRLRSIVALTERQQGRDGDNVLFLVDEILHGTNSHDRRIGVQAVMRTLLERGAVGVITTHDLALTEMDEAIPGVVNAHFQDHLEDGEMRFDYRMRPGVVEKSNALELMRSVGLDV